MNEVLFAWHHKGWYRHHLIKGQNKFPPSASFNFHNFQLPKKEQRSNKNGVTRGTSNKLFSTFIAFRRVSARSCIPEAEMEVEGGLVRVYVCNKI